MGRPSRDPCAGGKPAARRGEEAGGLPRARRRPTPERQEGEPWAAARVTRYRETSGGWPRSCCSSAPSRGARCWTTSARRGSAGWPRGTAPASTARLRRAGASKRGGGGRPAPPRFPFGTRVRVTNLENGRRVVVVIDDRGPFVRGRIIDLSEAAAARLGMLEAGVVRVRLKVLAWGSGRP